MHEENVKRLVHDQYVLNYIMQSLGFYKMCVDVPAHSFNSYKLKLYKQSKFFAYSQLCKSSLMAFNEKNEVHVYVSNDWRFKNAVGLEFNFTHQFYDSAIILAKSMTLDILKASNGFRWKNEDFLRNGLLDEMLVKADLEENDLQLEEENVIARVIKSALANDVPF